MSRRILFLIRGKFGDTLVNFAALDTFLERNPDVDAVLAVRTNYAGLIRDDLRCRMITFGSRFELLVKMLWLRLTGWTPDTLAVLWGFGGIVDALARFCGAPHRIYLDNRGAGAFTEWPMKEEDYHSSDPAWRVLKLLDPGMPKPERLSLPSLARRRHAGSRRVLVVPIADEPRRCLGVAECRQWLPYIRSQCDAEEIAIVISSREPSAPDFLGATWPEGVRAVPFDTLDELTGIYADCQSWFGVDTGLYHLAVAMGIPSWMLCGPIPARKPVFPFQKETTWARLAVLGDTHCDEKRCHSPHCMQRVIAVLTGTAPTTQVTQMPDGCPLLGHSATELDQLAIVHEATHRQA